MIKKFLWPILLILIIIPSFFRIIRPGFFPIQDDQQVFRLYEMDKCIKDWQIPCRWIPDGGYQYGYPQFNYYAPFVYYLADIFHLTGIQFIDSLKILIVLGLILGALGMYFLTREFFGEFPGFVAGVFYTYAPIKAQEIFVRGDISEFWATVFFPFILWGLYKLIKNGGKKYFAVSVVSIGGLFITHTISSFIFTPIIIFWAGYFIATSENWKKQFLKILITILTGLGLSLFFLLPALAERGFAHLETLIGGYFDYRQHFVTIKELFFSNHWGYGSDQLGPNDDLTLSTGIIHWILGLTSVLFGFLTIKKNKKLSILILGFGIMELVVLFMMHQKSSFIWALVKPLAYLQFPWRLLSISNFILSFLSGFAILSFGKYKYYFGALAVIGLLTLQLNFFAPKTWLNVTDKDELTGAAFERELTSSIFDYLPIYAVKPPDSKAPDMPEIISGSATFENYYKGTDYQTGHLLVSKDSVIRPPLFDFPGMTVTLNGKIIGHVNNNCTKESFCMGLITFDAPKGDYLFKVKLENTPVRTIGNIISTLSLISLFAILFIPNVKIFKK